MKKYKFTAAAIAFAALISGCSNNSDETNLTTAPLADPPFTSTGKLSAVENQPEDTAAYENTSQTEIDAPVRDKPDGFPAPYPSSNINNPQLLEELKGIISKAETAESIFNGKSTLIPLQNEEKDGYKLIDGKYAANLNGLIDRMYEGFKYSYWESAYGKEVEAMLPDVIKETENGIMMKYDSKDKLTVIDLATAVIADYEDGYADVTVLGQRGDEYIWRTYDMIDGVRGWVVRSYKDEKVTGEIAVFSRLLIDNRAVLDKIFGNGTPIKVNGDWNTQLVTIEDDIYGHGFYNGLEIEPFMTVEEMRQFMRDTFTSEIAESYISLYINRTYVEKDGRLFIISGSVLPQMGAFSLDNYTNTAISTYDVTSRVDWTDGNNTYTLPITITYEDGLWKLDTRLPMKEDRIIM